MIGAGVIGLSLALELRMRGHDVTVVDTHKAMRQASWSAAGMLAVEDSNNPPALLPLSQLSDSAYPDYLLRIKSLSGVDVPFQTETVVEYSPSGQVFHRPERSLDPRQLAAALLAALRQSGIDLFEEAGGLEVVGEDDDVKIRTTAGHEFKASRLVHTTGAWFKWRGTVRPCKGQMLRVQIPAGATVVEVHRSREIYIVPRTQGPQAGTALIGATVEDVGFDVSTRQADLDHLRSLAGALLPAFRDATQAPMVEAWAGLRPSTPDGLPLIGTFQDDPRQFIATGHFRNGILLAPGTAVAVADRMEGKREPVSMVPYEPGRFV